jgi:hypothetical protein
VHAVDEGRRISRLVAPTGAASTNDCLKALNLVVWSSTVGRHQLLRPRMQGPRTK